MNDPISTPQVPPIPLVPAEMLHALTVAHAEIARLRLAIRRLAEQDATLSLLCNLLLCFRSIQTHQQSDF